MSGILTEERVGGTETAFYYLQMSPAYESAFSVEMTPRHYGGQVADPEKGECSEVLPLTKTQIWVNEIESQFW